MGKVRYSGIINEVSGKLGDEVHSHNRDVNYVRKKTKKKFKKTQGRVKVMESFGNSGRGWGGLTELQMDQWDMKAQLYGLKSTSSRKVMKKGYVLYNYVTLNLQEIGEPRISNAPNLDHPDLLEDVRFEFINKENIKDIRLYFKKPISENTKVIISATKTLSKGQRRVDDSWYKKIGVIGSEFLSGDSIMARYLLRYKTMDETIYKIHFEYREVNKKSGISSFVRTYKMVLNPEKTS
jgi:hypothetical protein